MSEDTKQRETTLQDELVRAAVVYARQCTAYVLDEVGSDGTADLRKRIGELLERESERRCKRDRVVDAVLRQDRFYCEAQTCESNNATRVRLRDGVPWFYCDTCAPDDCVLLFSDTPTSKPEERGCTCLDGAYTWGPCAACYRGPEKP